MTGRRQRGMTLIEIMISIAIMGLMMTIAWSTIKSASEARTRFEEIEDRNHEIRLALARIVTDLEAAYLSGNEDQRLDNRRTMFVGRDNQVHFSSFSHVSLWADANESDQTVIGYFVDDDREHPRIDSLFRRELRRPGNEVWQTLPGELDVLVHGVEKVKFEYWDWKDKDWQDTWDTTKADAEKDRLPSRVRITITYKNPHGDELKIVTQARLLLQEMLKD